MNPTLDRPESRNRDGSDCPAWADTVPFVLRSEAFAEDLLPADDDESNPDSAAVASKHGLGIMTLLGATRPLLPARR
jgi:hypothetical protein